MAKSTQYYRDLLDNASTTRPNVPPPGQPQGQAQQESPIDYQEILRAAGEGDQPQPGDTDWADVRKGVGQGAVDLVQENLDLVAGPEGGLGAAADKFVAGDYLGAAGSVAHSVAGVPINLLTGGQGGEVLRRLDLGQYGPGDASTAKGQLAQELVPAGAIAVGGLSGGVRAAGKHLMRKYGPDPSEVALADRLGTAGRPREEYIEDVMAQSHPKGAPATKEQARAKYTEMKQAEDYKAPIMSAKPQQAKHLDINQPAPKPAKPGPHPQKAYRDRIKALIEDRDDLLSKRHMRELMADDGMTLAQFIKLKRQVGARTKPHSNPLMETPLAKQKRGAYAEAAEALDEMKLPDTSVALDMYGEGSQLWKVASNYKRAQGTVNKHVKISESGERTFNSRAFQQEVDAMDPDMVKEIFGDKFKRVVNAAKRVTYRGYHSRARAAKKASNSLVKLLTGWSLLVGVGGVASRTTRYAAGKLGRSARTQVVGAPMVRKHSDR